MNQDQAIELISLYFDDALTEAQAAELRAWLEANHEHVDLFSQYAMLHTGLEHALVTQDIGGTLQTLLNSETNEEHESDSSLLGQILEEIEPQRIDLKPLPLKEDNEAGKRRIRIQPPVDLHTPHDDESHRDLVFRMAGLRMYRTEVERSHRSKQMPWLSMAAVFMITALLGLAFILALPEDQPKPLATLDESRDPAWTSDSMPISADGTMVAGRYKIEKGFGKMTMNSGASVLLEAPCEFVLLNENRMRLIKGRLTARVPKRAQFFTVDTPTAEVVDLGTVFGVEVEPSGYTTAAVFKGKVNLTGSEQVEDTEESGNVVLTTGQQSSVNADGYLAAEPEPIPYKHRFVRSLRDADFDLILTGHIEWYRFIPRNTASHELTNDNNAIVYTERRDVLVDRPIYDVGTQTGTYTHSRFLQVSGSEFVPAGTRVDSILVHFNPEVKEGKAQEITMTVRFPRPIVGVIGRTPSLNETDALFGHPRVNYNNLTGYVRGVEATIDTNDSVTISPDRMTATIKLKTIKIDQVRFLIESE